LAIFVLAFSIDFASSKEEAVALIQLHRSFGITVGVVTLGRLVWRQFAQFPNWPADMPQAMRLAAQWSEYALYALLLTQPILGLLHTNAQGDRVNLFFVGQLPPLIGQNRPLAKQLLAAHKTVGLLLLGLIALHALAALYHHFWRRDDTLRAMLPQGMRRRPRRVARLRAEVLGSANPRSNGLLEPAEARVDAGAGASASSERLHCAPFCQGCSPSPARTTPATIAPNVRSLVALDQDSTIIAVVEGQPLRAGASVIDILGAVFGVVAAQTALREREITGKGQRVSSALFESAAFLMSTHMAGMTATGLEARPMPARRGAWPECPTKAYLMAHGENPPQPRANSSSLP
jgi:cytochrome b561